jgi:hypothetical protein
VDVHDDMWRSLLWKMLILELIVFSKFGCEWIEVTHNRLHWFLNAALSCQIPSGFTVAVHYVLFVRQSFQFKYNDYCRGSACFAGSLTAPAGEHVETHVSLVDARN